MANDFLSKLKLDEKKSELSAIFAKQKAAKEEPKQTPAVEEKPKHESGTYNAYIERCKNGEFPPMSEEEIYALVENLDAMSAELKENCISSACGSAELVGDGMQEKCAAFHNLERALYVAERQEDCLRIAKLMFGIYCQDVKEHGSLGVTVLTVDTFRTADKNSNASHNRKSLEMTKSLRKFVDVLLGKLDSIRDALGSDAYSKLCNYFEDMDIYLGQSADWFKTYSGETLKRLVFLRTNVGAQLKDGYDSFVFYDRVVKGEYDSWQKECCASVAVQHFYLCGDDKKTDTAEIVLLLDENGSHYTKRIAPELEENLKKEGCLGSGKISGELGKKLQNIAEELKVTPVKHKSMKYSRLIFATILCILMTAFIWLINPDGKEWLTNVSMIQLPIFAVACAVTGYAAGGRHLVVTTLVVGVAVFFVDLFLEQLLGMSEVTHNRVFFTIAMAVCVYMYLTAAVAGAKKDADFRRRQEIEIRSSKKKSAAELEALTDYVKLLKTSSERVSSKVLAEYYTETQKQIDALKAETK
ncbi:MAG: hypothetical protein IJ017_06265 [Oscillospiraceae bacterium]|nr:hypothetical protein [Oscillospiraceae bacterium]